eukprot:TRINITY_DN676_c0_g1_i2.p2 TRINITY_DN676_c0_g1~~TRINITY_DN676_c0_g1_i2.p2  ORF type:complete len:393 (+),score=129.47 TRINITY_DN676_c0_g1_i2:74-1252(+)
MDPVELKQMDHASSAELESPSQYGYAQVAANVLQGEKDGERVFVSNVPSASASSPPVIVGSIVRNETEAQWPFIVFIVVNCIAIAFCALSNLLATLFFPFAILPAAIYGAIFYRFRSKAIIQRNRLIFFWFLAVLGFVAALLLESFYGPVIIYNLVYSPTISYFQGFSSATAMGFLSAALLEEFQKFWMASIAALVSHPWFGSDSPWTTMVLGSFATLVVATVENCEYTMKMANIPALVFQTSLRDISSVPLHMTTGIFISTCIAFIRFHPRFRGDFGTVWLLGPLILIFPIMIHGSYDFALMLMGGIFYVYPEASSAWGLLGLVPIVCVIAGYIVQVICILKVRKLQAAFEDQQAQLTTVEAMTLEDNSLGVDHSFDSIDAKSAVFSLNTL